MGSSAGAERRIRKIWLMVDEPPVAERVHLVRERDGSRIVSHEQHADVALVTDLRE